MGALIVAALLGAGFTPDQLVSVGRGYVDRGEDDKAIPVLLDALKGQPKDRAEAEYLLGRALSRKERFPEAIEHLRKSLDLDATKVEVWMLLGTTMDLSHDEAAPATWEQAVKRFPNKVELRHELGLSLVSQGKAEEALAQLGEAYKLDPKREGLDGDLGYAMLLAKRCPEAVKVLTDAQARSPKDASVATHLGDAWGCQASACTKAKGKNCASFTSSAIKAYEAAVALDAKAVRAWFHLGLMRSKAGDRDGAVKAIETARTLDPDDPKLEAALEHVSAAKKR